MNIKNKISLPSIRELKPEKVKEKITIYLNQADKKNFFFIRTGISEGFHDRAFTVFKLVCGSSAYLRSFDFYGTENFPQLCLFELLADLLSEEDLELPLIEKNMAAEFLEQIKNPQNYNLENFYHLLLTIATIKRVVLVFHQIDQAGSDFLNSLLILAELLIKPEWRLSNLKIIALFSEDQNDKFNNFIDDLYSLNRPELISCISIHIREWRKKIREKNANNENKIGQSFLQTATCLTDVVKNDHNGLDDIIAFLKFGNFNDSQEELQKRFLELSYKDLALSDQQKFTILLSDKIRRYIQIADIFDSSTKASNVLKLQKLLACWHYSDNEINCIKSLLSSKINFTLEEKFSLQNRLLELLLTSGLTMDAESQAELMVNTALSEKSDFWLNTAIISKSKILVENRKFSEAQELIKSLRVSLQKNRETVLLIKNELNKADYCIELYDFKRAEEVLKKVLKITENFTNIQFIIEATLRLAYVKFRVKEINDALALCDRCFIFIEKYKCYKEITAVYALKSTIYLNGKKYREAMISTNKQLYFSRMYNQHTEQASAIKALANLYRQTGFIKSAEKFFLKHLFYTSHFQDSYLISISLFNLAEICLDQGKYESATEYLKSHENLVINLNHARAIIDNYAVMAKIYKLTGRFEEANLLYDKIIDISEKNNIMPQTTPTEKAELYFLIGKVQDARRWLDIAYNNYIIKQQNKPDLLLKISILRIKLDVLEGNISIKQAEKKYFDLFDPNHREIQMALLYFELYKLTSNKNYHKKALSLYSILYQEMPDEEYIRKICELKKS